MLERYTEIILSITAFELLFLAVLILLRKTQSSHYKILGLFLLFKGLCVANALFINFYREWIPTVPYLYVTGTYLAFTFGPLLYLFIRSLTSNRRIKLIDSIHFLPLILAFSYFAIRFFIHPIEEQSNYILGYRTYPSWWFFYSYWGVFYVLSIGYIVASGFLIEKYNRKIRNQLSSLRKIKINWLYPVLTAFLAIMLIDAANMYFAKINEVFQAYNIPVLETAFLIFANLFIYVGLTQPIIRPEFPDPKGERYISSKLILQEKREILQKLRITMSKDKLFLDPELSIEKLSKVSGTSTRNISQVINEILAQNFYEFVNLYRINAAKEQLADPEDTAKTVLEILYAVGFNSKSVFNACFKKMTGLTPTQYRTQKLSELQVG